MELPREHPVFPLEEQYEVAAWNSTVRSLSLLWTDPYLHIEARHIPKNIQSLARIAFKDPVEMVPFAEAAMKNSWRKDEYPAYLVNLGILLQNRDPRTRQEIPFLLNSSFVLMHELYYTGDDILNEIGEDARIERFESDIDTLASYNQKRLHEAIVQNYSLIDTIQTVQHDNTFYLGKWDGDRSLGVSDN